MTDRELLELAAKAAAGYEYAKHGGYIVFDGIPGNWNPLTDDGDALRLAVKLEIAVNPFAGKTVVAHEYSKRLVCEKWELHDEDPYAATRRAIVRAAAEIGRTM
jgi:hypothetical protein